MKQKRLTRLPAKEILTGAESGLVSVVLPVYNGEKYLHEAIRSVLCQTYENWELIVVDDGSEDESLAIAEGYAEKDSRIRVVTQENQKLPRALNRGFSLAKGEFYTWISGDNRYLPAFLETMVDELKKHPRADMVFGNQYLIDEQGERITNHGWFEFPVGSGAVCFPPATPLLNRVANNTIGAAFLYRAGCERVLGGYSPNLFLLEDYDYFMRMNSLFRIRHRKGEPLYEYRFHEDSLTARDKELGITASRPRLMAFDAHRRKKYRETVTCNVQGLPSGLSKYARRYGIEIMAEGEPCYQVKTCPDGYEVMRNSSSLAILKNLRNLAVFLKFRGLMDNLFEEEKEFFEKTSLPEESNMLE